MFTDTFIRLTKKLTWIRIGEGFRWVGGCGCCAAVSLSVGGFVQASFGPCLGQASSTVSLTPKQRHCALVQVRVRRDLFPRWLPLAVFPVLFMHPGAILANISNLRNSFECNTPHSPPLSHYPHLPLSLVRFQATSFVHCNRVAAEAIVVSPTPPPFSPLNTGELNQSWFIPSLLVLCIALYGSVHRLLK